MNSNAPGQLLGYSIQFPRALYHLLQCGSGDSVCVEVLGDVATQHSDGRITTEEDKSSIAGNPLTDKSTDLWKTFSNWIDAINAGELPTPKCIFLLFTNQKGRKGIVDKFNDAKNIEQAKIAIEYAKDKLKKLKDGHEIWPYYNNCIDNTNILLEVITRFELIISKNVHGFDEVRKEIEKKLVAPSQIEFLLENLSGWLQKEIITRISRRQNCVIKWEDFRDQFLPLMERIRKRELIDFTLQNLPQKDDLRKVVKSRPGYVRQLDRIGMSEDDILEAVADFMRAKANRDKWIDLEIIDVDVASDFEDRLFKFWQNQKKRIELTNMSLPSEDRGKLLYLDCRSRQETIRDMTPPSTTIAGTYHALADVPSIGWHDDWESEFSQ